LKKVAVLSVLLTLMLTGVVQAAYDFGTGCTFSRGTSTCVASWTVVATTEEAKSEEVAGACAEQSITNEYSRTRTQTDYYSRTKLYHGNNHLKGKLYSDSGDVLTTTTVAYSDWSLVSSSVSGECKASNAGGIGIGVGGTSGSDQGNTNSNSDAHNASGQKDSE